MRAATGGLFYCPTCNTGRIVAVATCPICSASSLRPPPPVSRHQRERRDRLVTVDCSWKDGVAHIAVHGALGEHARSIAAVNNTVGEALALLLAMELAEAANDGHRPLRLVFRTDALGLIEARRLRRDLAAPISRIRRYLASYQQWTLEWASRRHTGPADRLARKQRKTAPPPPARR